jgi:hypothetical protein
VDHVLNKPPKLRTLRSALARFFPEPMNNGNGHHV